MDSFWDCAIKSIELPSTLTTIDQTAFYKCRSLKKLILPETVREIGDEAVAWCSALENVYIPASLNKVGEKAFYEDRNLHRVIVPKSVTDIGAYAFACGYDSGKSGEGSLNDCRIYCEKRSSAKNYAQTYNVNYYLPEETRYSGRDRFDTASRISYHLAMNPNTVILANGMNYADALAGVPLAARTSTVMLLTQKDSIPEKPLRTSKTMFRQTLYFSAAMLQFRQAA